MKSVVKCIGVAEEIVGEISGIASHSLGPHIFDNLVINFSDKH